MSLQHDWITKWATAPKPQTLTVWQIVCGNLINCKYVWYLALLNENYKSFKGIAQHIGKYTTSTTFWSLVVTTRFPGNQRRLQHRAWLRTTTTNSLTNSYNSGVNQISIFPTMSNYPFKAGLCIALMWLTASLRAGFTTKTQWSSHVWSVVYMMGAWRWIYVHVLHTHTNIIQTFIEVNKSFVINLV